VNLLLVCYKTGCKGLDVRIFCEVCQASALPAKTDWLYVFLICFPHPKIQQRRQELEQALALRNT